MKARILWIEGKRANSPSFVPSLRKREHDVQTVETGKAGLAALSGYDPDLVVVHAASLRSNGKRICNNLRQLDDRLPIVLILDEGVPTPETGANVIATACPYCMVMMTDGLKYKNMEKMIKNYDIAELVVLALGL